MASTIIDGLVNNFKGMSGKIYVTDIIKEKAENLCSKLNINLCETNIKIAQRCDIIF